MLMQNAGIELGISRFYGIRLVVGALWALGLFNKFRANLTYLFGIIQFFKLTFSLAAIFDFEQNAISEHPVVKAVDESPFHI